MPPSETDVLDALVDIEVCMMNPDLADADLQDALVFLYPTKIAQDN